MTKLKKSIVLYPRGGLGNQLFQYGAALQLSKKLTVDIVVDDSLLNPKLEMNEGVSKRSLELNEFENQIKDFRRASAKSSVVRGKLLTAQRFIGDRAPNITLKFGVFANEASDQIEIFRAIRKPVAINSYCSSISYFSECEDALVEQITRIRNPSDWYLQISEELAEASPIALHVRLGDYKNLGSIYGYPDPDYYARGLRLIGSKIGERPIWLFSDEPELANEIIGKHLEVSRLVDPQVSKRAIEHLNLLGKCQGIVCANSSFSWWGGYLSTKLQRDSVVVFPKPMFDATNLKEPLDWIPEEWHRINRRIGLNP